MAGARQLSTFAKGGAVLDDKRDMLEQSPLAAIFSRAEWLKRQLRDILQNPAARVEQMGDIQNQSLREDPLTMMSNFIAPGVGGVMKPPGKDWLKILNKPVTASDSLNLGITDSLFYKGQSAEEASDVATAIASGVDPKIIGAALMRSDWIERKIPIPERIKLRKAELEDFDHEFSPPVENVSEAKDILKGFASGGSVRAPVKTTADLSAVIASLQQGI